MGDRFKSAREIFTGLQRPWPAQRQASLLQCEVQTRPQSRQPAHSQYGTPHCMERGLESDSSAREAICNHHARQRPRCRCSGRPSQRSMDHFVTSLRKSANSLQRLAHLIFCSIQGTYLPVLTPILSIRRCTRNIELGSGAHSEQLGVGPWKLEPGPWNLEQVPARQLLVRIFWDSAAQKRLQVFLHGRPTVHDYHIYWKSATVAAKSVTGLRGTYYF